MDTPDFAALTRHLKNISISLRVIEERQRVGLEEREIAELKKLYQFEKRDQSSDSSSS